jgi:predicted acetyltransferase
MTMKIRPAEIKDKAAFRELWDISFDDTKKFSDWLFDSRFVPEYSVLIEEDDGRVTSVIQGLPFFVQVRGKIVPSVMTAGVCTHPDYRKRGYMKELYTYYMNMVRQKGIPLCSNTPVDINMYLCVGNYPVSDIMFLETEKAKKLSDIKCCKIDLKNDVSGLLACYNIVTSDYSGAAKRSYADFSLKRFDYLAGDGKCIAIKNGNDIDGYAVYFDEKDGIFGEEIIAKNTKTEQALCEALLNLGTGRRVQLKLPSFSNVNISQCDKKIMPRNVSGITDISSLLKYIGKSIDITIKIDDDVVTENNGLFYINGEKSSKKAQLEFKIYRFVQWIFGYRSIKELAAEGNVNIIDKEAADKLDRFFPKQKCRIIDEY